MKKMLNIQGGGSCNDQRAVMN